MLGGHRAKGFYWDYAGPDPCNSQLHMSVDLVCAHALCLYRGVDPIKEETAIVIL